MAPRAGIDFILRNSADGDRRLIYGRSSDRTVFFGIGIGTEAAVKSIEIVWLSGVRQKLHNVSLIVI